MNLLTRFTRSILCLIVVLILSGCDKFGGDSLLTNGINPSLPSEDIDESTMLKELYFGHLCKQAELPYVYSESEGGGRSFQCDYSAMKARNWTTFTHQGMNDIDRRCDRFLAWLDFKKTSKAPLLQQIAETSVLAQNIMRFSGAGNMAIDIVRVAFGFAGTSTTNYHSLLLQVESSTVNTIVLTRQTKFRESIKAKLIYSKQGAEYVMRKYLRICLPFSIKTEINDLPILAIQNVPNASDKTINDPPVTGNSIGLKSFVADTGNADFEKLKRYGEKSPENIQKIFQCGNKQGLSNGKTIDLMRKGMNASDILRRKRLLKCLKIT